MDRERVNELERRKIVVRVRPSTWRDVQITAAYLGVHIQDLVGWIILAGIAPIVLARRKQQQEPGEQLEANLEYIQDTILEYAGGEE